jgi:hypothetical protein
MARRPLPEKLVLPDGKEKFSLSEAATAIGRHKITLYNWERHNQLPAGARPIRLKRNKERIYLRAQVEEIWRWVNETVGDSAA